MPTLDETSPGLSQHGPDVAGFRQLSRGQTIPFERYIRHVLPIDGYVFWLKTCDTFTWQGSLHYASDSRQLEDESPTINRVVLTAGEEIQPFNEIAPGTIWIGTIDGIRFAFSQRGPFYAAAGIYHYAGDAVYPAMASLLVDTLDDLGPTRRIVSNSLPAWLTLRDYSPVWLQPANPVVVLYPSFLVPDNLEPIYGTVHIEPSGTRALQASPSFTRRMTHSQLASDRVRVTLYGLDNDAALDWVDLVNQFSLDTDAIGMMSTSIIRDEKRTQNELNILAEKKTIEFEVSYYQARMNDLARQLILSAPVTFYPNPNGVL
ncbi:MAG: hypothetical protein WDN25_13395 [Acetobacteraceae bacterium]